MAGEGIVHSPVASGCLDCHHREHQQRAEERVEKQYGGNVIGLQR